MSVQRSLAKALLPDHVFQMLQASSSRRYQMRLLDREGLLDVAARYVERHGSTVRYGPFAGMIYPLEAALSRHSIPKLLGTYEQEIHDVLRLVATREYDVVIDIGSAEGYYAVGLAKLLQKKVLAFDPEPAERRHCEAAARLNDVAHLVEMRDLFLPVDIGRFAGQRVLCICDCEGFEAKLFTQATVVQTAKWDVIMELDGETTTEVANLNWPQRKHLIASTERSEVYLELKNLGDAQKLLSEHRNGRQTWLWCDGQG